VPRKVFDFNREEVTGDWSKNCMRRDFMIFPPSANTYNSSLKYLGGIGKSCMAHGGQNCIQTFDGEC
jgi:hypothetical protein